MLVENQIVEVSWHSQTKQHYIDKGYQFTKYRDKFNVKAEDLSTGATVRVLVICDYCGEEINMQWHHYVDICNKGQKCACYKCRHKKMYENNLLERQEYLYVKALKSCKNKGYTLITSKENIVNNSTRVEYLCPKHGAHNMKISNLINGKGCPDCAIEKNAERYKDSSEKVKEEIASLGGALLNAEGYVNNVKKNLRILCPECRYSVIITSRRNFTQHGGQVCDNCKSIGSSGERRIASFLESNNILFESQKWFEDCRDINPLPFDFYLPDYNMIIEFDGEQHYKDRAYKSGRFKDTLEYTQMHDNIKNNYCAMHNISLIRIPYWDYDNIENILHNILISHEDIV